ncbi:MAG TPA: hypothetical protein VF028_05575 [Actinomycetota bacterium]|nr:hypothetical protein [Actinomycetota bacterium]
MGEVALENHARTSDVGMGEGSTARDIERIDMRTVAGDIDPDQRAGDEDRAPLPGCVDLRRGDQALFRDGHVAQSGHRFEEGTGLHRAPVGEVDPDVVRVQERVALVVGDLAPGGHASESGRHAGSHRDGGDLGPAHPKVSGGPS